MRRAAPWSPLPAARDHKRLLDGDLGPNTGGMGAFSPVSDAPQGIEALTVNFAVDPVLAALRGRGIDFRGVLFAGLMLTPEGPKLLEFNVRLGDPEAQVVLPRITSDVPELLASAAAGRLGPPPTISDDAVVGVVCATPGYPEAPSAGGVILGFTEASATPGALVFNAGVNLDASGRLITSGGRVLTVCGRGATFARPARSPTRPCPPRMARPPGPARHRPHDGNLADADARPYRRLSCRLTSTRCRRRRTSSTPSPPSCKQTPSPWRRSPRGTPTPWPGGPRRAIELLGSITAAHQRLARAGTSVAAVAGPMPLDDDRPRPLVCGSTAGSLRPRRSSRTALPRLHRSPQSGGHRLRTKSP